MAHAFNYQEAITQLRLTYKVDLVALAIVRPEEQYVLKWKYISGNLNDYYQRITLQSGRGIAGRVFKSGKALIIRDVLGYIGAHELYQYPLLQFENIKSCLALPLFEYHRVKAVLLFASRQPDVVSDELYHKVMNDLGDCFGPLYVQEMMAN